MYAIRSRMEWAADQLVVCSLEYVLCVDATRVPHPSHWCRCDNRSSAQIVWYFDRSRTQSEAFRMPVLTDTHFRCSVIHPINKIRFAVTPLIRFALSRAGFAHYIVETKSAIESHWLCLREKIRKMQNLGIFAIFIVLQKNWRIWLQPTVI